MTHIPNALKFLVDSWCQSLLWVMGVYSIGLGVFGPLTLLVLLELLNEWC